VNHRDRREVIGIFTYPIIGVLAYCHCLENYTYYLQSEEGGFVSVGAGKYATFVLAFKMITY
jgi:hypothetical protein